MQPLITNLIGYTATVVGTCLMVPQVVKAWKTKQMKDVSSGMIGLYVLGCLLWLIYGLLITAVPLALANGIGLIVGTIQIWLKVKFT